MNSKVDVMLMHTLDLLKAYWLPKKLFWCNDEKVDYWLVIV